MRYVNLGITETFRMISSPVKKRFPTYQHLIDAGLMTKNEVMEHRYFQLATIQLYVKILTHVES